MTSLLLVLFWLSPAWSAALPDTSGHVLVIGTKEAPPFVIKNPDGSWSGLSIDLWRHIAQRLGVRYRLQEETLPDLISKTGSGELDASLAAITVTAERDAVVDFTQPYYATGLGVTVSRTRGGLMSILGKILTPHFLAVVVAVSCVLVIVGIFVWLLERRYNPDFGDHRRGMRTSIMWAAMTAAGAGASSRPRTFTGELIHLGWVLTSVLLISSFTAVITSSITAETLQGSVRSFDDLRRVRVGTVRNSAPQDYLDANDVHPELFADLPAALKALSGGLLDAVVYDRPLLAWTVRQDFASTLEMLDLTFDKQTYAVALPPRSELRLPMDLILLQEVQADWWQRDVASAVGGQ